MRRHFLILLSALIFIPALSAFAEPLTEANLYTRQGTWQTSLIASLKNLWELKDQELAAAKNTDERGIALGPWYAIGSFSNVNGVGFNYAYPPETEIVLDKTYDGMNDSKAQWRRMDMFIDGQVHNLQPHFSITEAGIAYLYRTITAREAIDITGYFGSDDGLAVWLNGEKLISNDVPRGPSPDQDQAPLKLHAGENYLLLKIVNRTGGFGFYFNTRPGGGTPEESPLHRNRIEKIWQQLTKDFNTPAQTMEMKFERDAGIWPVAWHPADITSLHNRYRDAAVQNLTAAETTLIGLLADRGATNVISEQTVLSATKAALNAVNSDEKSLLNAQSVYHTSYQVNRLLAVEARLESLTLAVTDLATTYGAEQTNAVTHQAAIAKFSTQIKNILSAEIIDNAALASLDSDVQAQQQQALIKDNPLFDFDNILCLARTPGGGNPGLPQNWQSNSSLPRNAWDTTINTVSVKNSEETMATLKQVKQNFIGDLCLSFDGQKILFSMTAPEKGNTYQIYEINSDGANLRMITEAADNDYDNYDACYLPNGQIMFTSSRCYQAVPCTGGDHVALMYVMNADGTQVRQLTFDQDHSWNPRVMNDGRIIYTRWEYNDTPHYFSRILFTMSPDGTRQGAIYGTNSWFPNTTIGARAIPGSDSKIVAIISGHHGNPRMGEVAILDIAQGEREADGIVQLLPQRHRKVEAVIVDQYATGQWPQFTQPYPLSDKYFIVSCKLRPDVDWGLYLVDIYDNLVPIRLIPNVALMEPIPLRATKAPPVISPAIDLKREDALVYLNDVYRGRGLEGVPRGTIKRLRLIEPVYRYWGNGETHTVAIDGTWDVKKILGTVPVEEDGSAWFRVPANTPIAVQPINEQGMAQQQMRSWFTAMPGEVVSCVGCHENRRDATAVGQRSKAQKRAPSTIEPWYGEARGFEFEKEIQPILDRNCVRCHSKGDVDLRSRNDSANARGFRFSPAYDSLHPYVRRPGNESDIHLLPPREFEVSTSPLVQMLRKGHKKVKLTAEDWDRLITWIDLNIPYAGNWKDAIPSAPDNLIQRREEIRRQDFAVQTALSARGVASK